MTADEWWQLAKHIDAALYSLSYGTGDYAIMTVALAVAYDLSGNDGAWEMQARWNSDLAALKNQRTLIEN